jgi:hypothetical protein
VSGERSAHRGAYRCPRPYGCWLVDDNYLANTINRYTVRSRSRFKANADGSIDLYIQ